jgi:hypothetical protein
MVMQRLLVFLLLAGIKFEQAHLTTNRDEKRKTQ